MTAVCNYKAVELPNKDRSGDWLALPRREWSNEDVGNPPKGKVVVEP